MMSDTKWEEYYINHGKAVLRDALTLRIKGIHKSCNEGLLSDDVMEMYKAEQKYCYEKWVEYNDYCGINKLGKWTPQWKRENIDKYLVFEFLRKG